MKTTLNLGSFNFNINTASDRITNGSVGKNEEDVIAPQNTTTATVELKDISVTFEASIEETLEDIKMSLECFKELKSLASEFGNIFAGMEAKRQEQNHELEIAREKRYDEADSRKSEFERKFQAMSNRIEETTAEIKESFANIDSRIEDLEAIKAVKGN